MKKSYFFALFLLLFFLTDATAQSPDSFKYQAVIRDASSSNILANQQVSLLITLRQNTIDGTIVYEEEFNQSTNTFGLVNLEIGNGNTVLGTFEDIDWGSGPYFIETSIDQTGGNNHVSMGTSQLLSVPYALYAKNAGNTLWKENGNNAYYNNGNVGIGINTPETYMHVSGPNARTLMDANGISSSVGHQFRAFSITSGQSPEGEFRLYNTNKFVFNKGFFPNQTELVAIDLPTGNVGIGTLDPEAYMHVSGPNARTLMDANGISSSVGHQFRAFSITSGQSPEGEFRLYNTNKFVFNRGFVPNQTEVVAIDLPTGNVGIGTLDPAAKLQVEDGDIYIEDINKGVIMKSPNGLCWRMTIDNTGNTVTSQISCP